MNLHIVPDSSFINKFYDNLQESGVLHNNKIVVRTPRKKLKYIKRHDLPFAKLYSALFNSIVGDTEAYEKVFIHQFTPLLYRWVAAHDFKELDWIVWGADLYSLPNVKKVLHENLTLSRYVRRKFSTQDLFYRIKVLLLHRIFRKAAYGKVKNVLTWMTSEYEFALQHVPSLKGRHQFFFYENQIQYEGLNSVLSDDVSMIRGGPPIYILGNSSSSELNHLDAVDCMNREGVKADLLIPLSYGDQKYAHFLKKNLIVYSGGEIQFMDHHMNFDEYLQFLYRSDGLIMNNIRPQGYGNIFMMMYLGKKIFLNEKNISIPDLNKSGLIWRPIREIGMENTADWHKNKSIVSTLLGHEKIVKLYRELFS